MPNKQLTIVIIRAPGYTGATWINTILGCHKRAMAMGPPNRFWKLDAGMSDQACLIHGQTCTLWPQIIRNSPKPNEWFHALAEASGRDTFILNYPDTQFYETVIAPIGAQILHIKVVRDGRASLYSKIRHHNGDDQMGVFRNIMEWQIPKWNQIERKLPKNPEDYYFLRYEDLLMNPRQTLAGVSRYIGLNYDADAALRFWEWEHHLTAGNVGMLDMICRLQGLPGHKHARRAEYDKVIQRIRAGGPALFLDESWKTGLNGENLLVFDCLLGEWNAAHGYPRDSFTEIEKARFWSTFDRECGRLYGDPENTDESTRWPSITGTRRWIDLPMRVGRRICQGIGIPWRGNQ